MSLLFITTFARFIEANTRQMRYKYMQEQNNPLQITEKICMVGTVPSELSSSFKICQKTLTERKRSKQTAAQI